MRRRWRCTRRLILLGVLAALLAGCGLGGVGREGELEYVAAFEHVLAPGGTLPGTGITFLDHQEEGARVLIGGQETLRKVGDSLDWQDEPLDGVAVDWSLRVAPSGQDSLRVVGTVTVTVRDPVPVAAEADTRSEMQYTAPVTLNAGPDEALPGTTLVYLGSTDQGAHLGNVEGYAYRKVADSITWEGRLKDRLHIRFSTRVVFYTADRLQVFGTATLWIGP
jgi:hypothetical protein